jgi:hypothetical protein
MFTTYPTYSKYRVLFLTSPRQQGEDVFALQTALDELNFEIGTPDGIFGSQTNTAVREAQRAFRIVVDGKAGGATQKELTLELASRAVPLVNIPFVAFKGQLELESGFRVGIYSPQRPDGTYDAGVAQRNTQFTPPKDGFDPKKSIIALGKVVNKHYLLFEGLPARRRWALAQGAWNAPAFACYIAKEEGATQVTSSMTAKPNAEARQVFETYVANASVYLVV